MLIDTVSKRPWPGEIVSSLREPRLRSLSYWDYPSTQLNIPYVQGPCKTHRGGDQEGAPQKDSRTSDSDNQKKTSSPPERSKTGHVNTGHPVKDDIQCYSTHTQASDTARWCTSLPHARVPDAAASMANPARRKGRVYSATQMACPLVGQLRQEIRCLSGWAASLDGPAGTKASFRAYWHPALVPKRRC